MAGQRDRNEGIPRFAADRMLGRLARWLRLAGCDTLQGDHLGGRLLLRAARSESRVLLTRDRRLLRKAPLPPHLFVRPDDFRGQLRQVLGHFGIDPHLRLLERCSRCNGRMGGLPPGPGDGVRGHPPFRRCVDCGHVVWQGSHVERILRELERMGFPPPAGTKDKEDTG